MQTAYSNNNKPVTTGRAALAIAVAVVADAVQLPATLGVFSEIFTGKGTVIDPAVDIFMAVLSTGLLGFYWALLPPCVIEAIPVVDVAPTWTACVSFVAWRRVPCLARSQRQHSLISIGKPILYTAGILAVLAALTRGSGWLFPAARLTKGMTRWCSAAFAGITMVLIVYAINRAILSFNCKG